MIDYSFAVWLPLLFTVASLCLSRFKPPGSFGLGGGGSAPSETTTTTSTTEPPEFVKPFSQQLLNRASALSFGFTPQPPSGAQQVVGFSPEEQAAFGFTSNRALEGAPGEFSLANALALQGTGGVPGQGLIAGSAQGVPTAGLERFSQGDLGFDPVTNALVQRQQGNLLDQFNTQVAPSTAARFQQGGIFGGTAQQDLESQQRFSLARALGDTEAGIRGDAVNRAFAGEQALAGIRGTDLARQLAAGQALGGLGEAQRARQLGAAGLFGELGGQREDITRQRIADLESVGTQQRGLAQLISDIDVQNLLQQQQLPLSRLDILGSAINTAGGGFTSQTGTTTGPGQPQPNPFISALGGFGQAAGGIAALAGLFSSKELKRDDGPPERILDRVKRLPVRTWRYKWDDVLHIGPYAEDFQTTFGLGNGVVIPVIDAFGVLFQSVKELAEQVDALEARNG